MSTATINRINTTKVAAHRCDYKGCDKSFPTKQGLDMHIGRKHTRKIQNKWDKPRKRMGRPPKIRVDGSISNGHVAVKPKRKYTKRAPTAVVAAAPKLSSTFDVLNLPRPDFCPKCGVRPGREFCGDCGMSIKVLTVALYLAEKHASTFVNA